MTWTPPAAQIEAVERELHQALDNGEHNAPDGYHRPLAEAIVTAAHEAQTPQAADVDLLAERVGNFTLWCKPHKEQRSCVRMAGEFYWAETPSAALSFALLAHAMDGPTPRPDHVYTDDEGRCEHCSASPSSHPSFDAEPMPAALVVDATTHRETDDAPEAMVRAVLACDVRAGDRIWCGGPNGFRRVRAVKPIPVAGIAADFGERTAALWKRDDWLLLGCPPGATERALALAVDSLHAVAAESTDHGWTSEAETALKAINEQMGGSPDTMYRLPNRSGQ
jgi:hypothetical protein